jgi:hypothetical protein
MTCPKCKSPDTVSAQASERCLDCGCEWVRQAESCGCSHGGGVMSKYGPAVEEPEEEV